MNSGGTVSDCYATGNVTAGERGYSGGLVGADYEGTITKSYATGKVASTQWGLYIGGLVGFNNSNCTITDSYAIGDAIAPAEHTHTRTGGLAGNNYGGTVTNSYATGTVTPGLRLSLSITAGHGLLGNIPRTQELSTVTASYWDTETTGQATDSNFSTSEVGVGKTTSQLQTPTSATGIYSDWDSETWDFGTASEYPILKGVAGQN